MISLTVIGSNWMRDKLPENGSCRRFRMCGLNNRVMIGRVSKVELWFMGTSAGMPIRGRNVTSVVLRLSRMGGASWMFDCGEGTQHQLLRTPLKLTRLRKLFVTHLHGDHVFGIPGLLSSRASLGATEPLDIYGPPGLREMAETALRISETHLGYPLEWHEVDEGIVCEDAVMKVEAAALDHRIACFGYRVTELPHTGMLNVQWLSEIGLAPGPAYGKLKAGEDVVLPDGRLVRASEAVGEPHVGRVVAVLGDTRPCAGARKLAQGADVLVHEATFGEDLADKAEEYGHSTTLQAAATAREAVAGRLFLTHYSSRYRPEDLPLLEAEARQIFACSEAAVELIPYAIPRNR